MYKFSAKAKKDLLSITQYTTEQFGLKQSNEYLRSLKETLDKISIFPRMVGRLRNEIGINIFSFVCKSHTIYYQQKQNYLFIIRILNNRMDHQKYL
ncbi:TPA: type II toxin-antitoxin system RelE/ParE family toxin [Mannheimia haemolytica]